MPKSICIAPGHGGFDSGATGNGLEEKNINLAICLDLEKLLTAAGIRVVMTRTDDHAAGDATTEIEDVSNQCKIANDANVDLFFSIHTNAGGGHGAEGYCNVGNVDATALTNRLVEAIAPVMGVHGEPVKNGMGLYVIKNTNMSAILLEVGFIDSDDAAKIEQNSHHFADLLAPVLIGFLGGSVTPSEPQPQPTPQPQPQPAPQPGNTYGPYVTLDTFQKTITVLGSRVDALQSQVAAIIADKTPAPQPEPQPQPTPAPTSGRVDVVTLPMDVMNDGFFFDCPVSIPNKPDVQSVGKLQLDTGAYEILIDKSIADFIGLPNMGAQTVQGVGGTVDCYLSILPVKIGDTVYNMQCTVDPNWTSLGNPTVGLFGMKGLIENGFAGLDINFKESHFTIYK